MDTAPPTRRLLRHRSGTRRMHTHRVHTQGLLLILVAASLLAFVAPGAAATTTAAEDYKKVYLSKSDALAFVFPEAERIVEVRHLLSASEVRRVEDRLRKRLDAGGYYLYAAFAGGRAYAYAVVVAEVGKVKPITHIVEVGPDGVVGDVAVMIYRESQGADVADPRFMRQFAGKTLDDKIRVNRDVINVAGSTLSAHAVCRGVKKALAVVQVVLIDRDDAARAALLATGIDVTPGSVAAAAPAPVPTPSSTSSGSPTPTATSTTTPTLTSRGQRLVVDERAVMGTVCRIEAWAPFDDAAIGQHLAAALDEVARWDDVLSNWRADTPLSRLNAAPVGTAVAVDPDLMAWLLDAQRWSRLTHGAFDPAMGRVVDAWQLNTREPGRPTDRTLDAARGASGWAQLRLDPLGGTVTRLADVALDPGASGKGFALDRAARVLNERGVTSALLSFRSTLLALAPPPDAAAWTVPVVHDGDQTTVTTVSLAHEALSVSGGTFHAFLDADVQRGHVIDPASGVPVEAGRLAWVRHPSAAAADALSTALLVRGSGLGGVAGAEGGFLDGAGSRPRDWPLAP